MKKIEYESEGLYIFEIKDEVNEDVFWSTFEILKKKIGANVLSSYGDPITGEFAKAELEKNNIYFFIEYDRWFGTELKIDKNISQGKLEIVREWVKIIKEELQKNPKNL